MFWRIPQDSFFSILSFWFFHNRFLLFPQLDHLNLSGLLPAFSLTLSLLCLPQPSLLCMYLSIVRQMQAPFVLPLTLLQGLCLGMREPQPILGAAHGSSWHLVSISRLWAIGAWQCCIVLPSKYEQYGPTSAPLTAYSLLSLLWCGGTWSAGPLSLHAHTHTHTWMLTCGLLRQGQTRLPAHTKHMPLKPFFPPVSQHLV